MPKDLWMYSDPILQAAEQVDAMRSEMEWIWMESGYDYFGDAYQAAMAAYDEAVAYHNLCVRKPYGNSYKPFWRKAWA